MTAELAGVQRAETGAATVAASQNRLERFPKISVSPLPVTISQVLKVTKWSIDNGEFERERTSGRADQR
jgi:hypothetical protein